MCQASPNLSALSRRYKAIQELILQRLYIKNFDRTISIMLFLRHPGNSAEDVAVAQRKEKKIQKEIDKTARCNNNR